MSDEQSIIIKRVNKCPHCAHGGAWKVAFADFMTAAMAFFLMLWILGGSSDSEMKAMAEYFRDPTVIEASPEVLIQSENSGKANDAVIDMGGFQDAPKADTDLQKLEEQAKEREQMEALKQELEARIEASPVLQEFKEQLKLDITPNGLQVQILDDRRRPMFSTGVDAPRDYAINIIREVGRVLSKSDKPISIAGHTDSSGYSPTAEYTNWELSADRANAARRIILQSGVGSEKIAQVVGLADTAPFDKENPYNPRNRRISIILLTQDALERIKALSDAPVQEDLAAQLGNSLPR
ncbi:MAG: flagellar motor protein MotB [Thiomicrospira sp.]|jgi:chemotaxis protein MotB|nr:flagellar motor protein MotB [Thiomicrospira sp.]